MLRGLNETRRKRAQSAVHAPLQSYILSRSTNYLKWFPSSPATIEFPFQPPREKTLNPKGSLVASPPQMHQDFNPAATPGAKRAQRPNFQYSQAVPSTPHSATSTDTPITEPDRQSGPPPPSQPLPSPGTGSRRPKREPRHNAESVFFHPANQAAGFYCLCMLGTVVLRIAATSADKTGND